MIFPLVFEFSQVYSVFIRGLGFQLLPFHLRFSDTTGWRGIMGKKKSHGFLKAELRSNYLIIAGGEKKI